MNKCYDCHCMYTVQRKYGVTNHCWATTNHLDVTYYCEEDNKDKENPLCPLVNADHHCGIDISHAKDDNDEST